MPKSKLSVLCTHLIEAGWLAVVVTLPLYINLYASRSIEPDRVFVLRTLATIMIAAWLIKWLEEKSKSPAAPTTRGVLFLPTLFIAGVFLITTFTSLAPPISFFGAYPRPEGSFTLFAHLAVFALMSAELRTRAQVRRLIFAIILTSVPVALYGLIQMSGLDPFVWKGEVGDRIGSTLGNPIFLGAFVLFPFAITASRLLETLRHVRATAHDARRDRALAVLYGLIAALQFSVLMLSGSRGPFLGWLAGLGLSALVLIAIARQRAWFLGLLGAGGGVALLLVAINLPQSPLAVLRDAPMVGRLAAVAINPGDSATARLLYWEGVAALNAPHTPIQYPDGATNGLNPLRWLVGYGPDALYLAYNQFFPPALARLVSNDTLIDRSHNETWDAISAGGVLGLAANQVIFLGLVVLGLRALGLITTHRERNALIGLWCGLGLLGGLVVIALGQTQFLGLAIPVGTLAGLGLYLIWRAFDARRGDTPWSDDTLLLVGLLGGILAHYVEIQFGIAVVATRAHLAVFAAMLAALALRRVEPDAPREATRPSAREAVGDALVVALVLMALLNLFIRYKQGVTDLSQLVAYAFVGDAVAGLAQWSVTALLAITWSVAVAFRLIEARTRSLRAFALLSLGVPALFALGSALGLTQIIALEPQKSSLENLLVYADRLVQIPSYFMLALGVFLAFGAYAFGEATSGATKWIAKPASALVLVPLLAIVALTINMLSLNPSRADTYRKLGDEYSGQKLVDAATMMYLRAVQFAPREDYYYMTLGRSLALRADVVILSHAQSPSRFTEAVGVDALGALNPQQFLALNRSDLLYLAQAAFLRAHTLAPLFPHHSLNLARFYQPELPVNTPGRVRLAEQSDKFYAQAIRVHPNNLALWNEWADFELQYRNNPDAALEKLAHARARDARVAETWFYTGKAYAAKKEWEQAIGAYEQAIALQPKADTHIALGDVYRERPDWERAIAAYRQALVVYPNASKAQSRLAFAYYQQGKFADAIAGYQRFIEMSPRDPGVWEAHKNLALLYEQTGDRAAALRAAQSARQLAPAEVHAQLDELIARLGKP